MTEPSLGENGPKPSAFKRAQARYKRRGEEPYRIDDLDELVDFGNAEEGSEGVFFRVKPFPTADGYDGPMYGLVSFPGFLYAPQALSKDLQEYLTHRSVSEYCEPPHTTNIDLVEPKQNEQLSVPNMTMWKLWKHEQDGSRSKHKGCRKKSKRRYYKSFEKLSWATMGYQYDWTARAYHEGAKSPIPTILQTLGTRFANISLSMECKQQEQKQKHRYDPSACIVNFYNCKSIMGGHRDDLELALDKPVILFNMGLAAVFLLGGKTKDCLPVLPILVRPGDVMVLGGDTRMNYHGMARIIPAEVKLPQVSLALRSPQPHQLTIDQNDEAIRSMHESGNANHSRKCPDLESDREYLAEFLRLHRININVRQVLPDGMDAIPSLEQSTPE